MNWIKLNQDYPLAYKLMVESIGCLYMQSTGSKMTSDYRAVIHPLKRDLYEFFDGVEIYVNVVYGWLYVGRYQYYIEGIDFSYYGVKADTRKQAETEAFTKAFEILNDRLK